MRLRQRLITLPPGVDIVDFVANDGKPREPSVRSEVRGRLTLGTLRDRYLDTLANGTIEKSTLGLIGTHFKHLVRTFGEQFALETLTLGDIQKHVDRRARQDIKPVTIKKELTTFRAAWNWATDMGLVTARFPIKGIRYPKTDEKPPYMTRDEIERRIAAGGLTDKQIRVLWGSLYLQAHEVAELVEFVRANATQPWVAPYATMVAHTGMRRSELLRVEIADLDFEGGTILVRERKRVKGTRSTRRAIMTPLLRKVLTDWLSVHPGGSRLFTQPQVVVRSKTKRTGPTPVTRDQARDHFRRTIRGSKWAVMKGVHTLRHSVVSCLAAAGVDQRVIDEIVGHQTEEQRRRYRHLAPQVTRAAVEKVFGSPATPPAGT